MHCKTEGNGVRVARSRGTAIFDKLDKRRLYTVDEIAGVLTVSSRTIRDWVYLDKIPYFKVCGAVRFDVTAIQEWLEMETV